jgi:class 3 adenylate cyclase/tetratricopeptide (TPR) repeat protein
MKFCGQCAAPLAQACPKCGAENPAGFKFCGQCAEPITALEPTPAPASGSIAGRPESSGERRHLTVLFSDLVNSTAIAAQLDPEEWREVVASYHRAAGEAITRFGGHIAKYLGDGIMAYFGWPEAHDNDAERAARAGLAIIDALAKLNEQAARPKLAARVGIDSGTVVIGVGAGKDADIFGDTPNIAARVQAAAESDSLLVTGATHRLISGLFIVDDRGPQSLKGVEQPLPLYRVIRPSGMRGRFEAVAARGLTPFVGREEELRLLLSRWRRVLDGEGQTALIIGEAGIGKSRLLHRLREWIIDTPHTWLESGAAAFFQNTPFHAVTEMLRQTFHWRANQNNERRLAALEASLAMAGIEPDEGVPLIASLLELPLGDKYSPLKMAPDQQRKLLLSTLVRWTIGFAKDQPLVFVVEDLHWADPSTLELIQLLVEQSAAARLLLLFTARSEFRPQWPPRVHHAQITLNRLSAADVRAMVEQVAARRALSREMTAAVIERTGGAPLFIEELIQAVLERGDTAHREIPATLHDSLMARLDRLGPAKEVVQIGAVLGGEFSYALLHAVHPLAEDKLERALRAACEAELLYVRGVAPEATYQFKHALIRDAAYEALLKSRRKELHLRAAQTIDGQFSALKEAHPEVLARHWTEAGEVESASAEWTKGGKLAEAANAFAEAQESYRRAVSQLKLLAESPDRDLHEFELMQSLVRVLFITKGYTEPETAEAANRAVVLAEKSGNLRKLLNLTISRGISAAVGGHMAEAAELAERAVELGSREGSPSILGRAHLLQMMVHYYAGDLGGAESHFEEGSKFFDDRNFRRVPGVAVAAFNYGAETALRLGRLEVGRERIARMLAATNRDNAYDSAFAGRFAGEFQCWIRAYEEAERTMAWALELAEKHQLRAIAANSRCILGMAQVQLERPTDGISLIRDGIAETRKIGEIFHSLLIFLAAAYEHAGAFAKALETVNEALELSSEVLVYRPEILRIRGDIRVRLGQPRLGETDFRESIEAAQAMCAKFWELRSTVSLARLLVSQNRRDGARAMLADIYGWFTEGFDTADLKDAKALLDELSS